MDKEELYEKMKDYKPDMTSAERIGAYLSGQRVDHIPFAIMSTNRIIANELNYTIKDMEDIDKLSDIIQYKYDHYKIVGLTEELSLRTMGHALGSKLIFPENDIDYIEEFLMEDELDMDLVSIPDPYTNEVLAPKLERARKLKERFPHMSIETEIPGPITTAAAIRPIEKLLRDLRKQPEKVKELLEFCINANMSWAKAFKNEFGPSSVMVVDPVGCDDILSPKQVKEFSLPYLKKQLHLYYQLNEVKPNLHICGHTNRQWQYYKDLDIDFFSVDNCENLRDCKEEIEDQLIVVGNIPPVEVMLNGSIDEVIASVKDCIKKAADAKSGYIAATGCGSPVGTPIENLDAFIYAINKYGKDAKLGEMPKAINE
ncbi:uroporphyrinogen decarboxylase family protein [Anaerococcus sp. mt242]|uniref:uroporphyrinogen decarboxylase family protein n=1 Tax=Anaerococcus sp. mt242 TaxID=2661917 RepID=UPI0019328001|nr:uroporphyrinogen decarboxylase family protein [Anaerococcus sp. mt242]MBM0046968.1 uroporphyrinogen decarboxylase family protein [Anaerococcus sp. mt242]